MVILASGSRSAKIRYRAGARPARGNPPTNRGSNARRTEAALNSEAAQFRHIFRRLHGGHSACLADEWLNEPCRDRDGTVLDRPIIWSRRNGPWRRVEVLWVGAAPGNAGGRGTGDLGAHGTRIPFGGDVAGANLEVLLSSIGLTRNATFIIAALNHLPARGGGEPAMAEIFAPEGGYDTSIDLLRDTLLAAGPAMIIALGNVAARAVAAAWGGAAGDRRLPGLTALRQRGWDRGHTLALEVLGPAEPSLDARWSRLWKERAAPVALWLMHPSAQNMSPFAAQETAFHRRMIETRDALRAAVRDYLGWIVPRRRPEMPSDGIYALPEWRDRIRARADAMDRMWREKGI